MTDWTSALYEWRTKLAHEGACDFDVLSEEPELVAWLERVFADNGALPADQFGPMVLRHRLELAQGALGKLQAAFLRDRGLRADLELRADQPSRDLPMGRVWVDQTAILAMTRADVLVEIADGFQDYVAGVHWQVWPECPQHGNGAHPETIDGRATWMCRAGNHPVAAICVSP